MNSYNTKLILSCLKQKPTFRVVTPNSVRTLEEEDQVKEALAADAAEIVMAIAEKTQLLIIHL